MEPDMAEDSVAVDSVAVDSVAEDSVAENEDAQYHSWRRQQATSFAVDIDAVLREGSMPRAPKEVLLRRLKRITEHTFEDQDIAWEACQFAGNNLTQSGARCFSNGNKRLAIVGDRAAEIILCLDWYATPHVEASYSTARENFTSDACMSHVAMTSGLIECLNVNPLNPIKLSQKPVRTLLEAVVGALYLDAGEDLAPVKNFMQKLGLIYGADKIEWITGSRCTCGLEHRRSH